MKSLDNIAEDLFNKIRGRFPSVTIGDQDGKITNDPLTARFFDFDYKEGDRNIGKVSVSVSEDKLSVMYSNSFVENEDTLTRQNWYNFLKELRIFAKKRLLQFDTRDITKSNLDKRDYKFLAQQQGGEQTMSESKMYGTSKISYQNIGNARVSIKHTESVNQELASGRTQKIGAIYVENAEGERFKYPFKHLNGARAMARHVSEGGKPYDDFGKHITGLSEELANLKKFKTYMSRSSVMAESLAGYVDVVVERLDSIKKTIAQLQKESYYKEAVEGYEAPIMEEVPEDVAENWIEQLTIKQFNEDLKDVFPYVYKLVSEASKAKEVTPENLEEFDIMNPIDSVKKWHKDRMSKYEAELTAVRQKAQEIDKNGALDAEATCNADPIDCLKQFIADNGGSVEEGERHGNSKIYDKCWDGYEKVPGKKSGEEGSCRKKTSEDAIETAIESLMGQFAEDKDEDTDEGNAYAHAVRKAKMDGKKKGDKVKGPDGDEITLEKEQKTPLGEFILSYFDRHTGQFPKGETAVLTMVEKDYGEEYITPAKQFIEMINNKVAEMYGYKDTSLEEAPDMDQAVAYAMQAYKLSKGSMTGQDDMASNVTSSPAVMKKVQKLKAKAEQLSGGVPFEKLVAQGSKELNDISKLAGL